MFIKLAEYEIKKESLGVVLKSIKVFVQAVRKHEPHTFYEAYRRGESFEFVHLMKFFDSDAEKRHATAVYTQEFVGVLYPHCLKEPVFTNLTSIK